MSDFTETGWGLTRIPWIKTHLLQTSMREAFPKKGKAVVVLIHLIKSKPQSSNQQKLKFYSDSCNWTKSERVRVFTDQARAGEGRECPGSERITHLSCLHKAELALRAGAGISFHPKVRQVPLFGGHFCWADFIWCCIVFNYRWDFCFWLKKSPLAVEVPRDCCCQKSKSPELRSAPFCPCPWPQGVSSLFCNSALQAGGEVPAPQGQWGLAAMEMCWEPPVPANIQLLFTNKRELKFPWW